ncbi:conjugal transfer protein TraF [Candidatus Woesearchaeota archaeon]|nr:conjugal transfer protein TraF [Candidatus Woesearchaeota archaeon]MBW3022373.1 conjugal transfer protein TraF [Candidatus Woesearchaeota archaeon]
MRRDISKTKFITVFAVTALIFVIGVLIGSYITGIKLDQLTDMQDDLKTHAMSVEMQYEILSEDPCRAVNSTPLTDELNKIGERLVFMENELGWDDKNVMMLKEYFSLLELRHWLLMKKNNEICDERVVPILYFYSNKGDCPKCEQQGFVLTNLKRNHAPVRTYHFDINIENPAIDTVKDLYNVKYAPAIVIGEKTFHGFLSKEKLEELYDEEA